MMLDIESRFKSKGAQKRVAEFLLKRGIRVSKKGELLVNDVEISAVSVARVLDVDRRVVKSAVNSILADERLSSVFGRLSVTPSLREIAPLLGFDVTLPGSRTFGGRVGSGDIAADSRDELLAAYGRDPAADAIVWPHAYVGGQLWPLLSVTTFPGSTYGANVTGASLGY